ncbi:MAG: methionyl-tRNA formyltransferase [Rhodospirillales bacterium]|jgi:methionyl-tRNA formyltransferase|nr:methionyl-tRNA formyltransferase [Rhodospirillales bacterium]
MSDCGRLRLAFMGSPSFALPTLSALIAAGHEIVCVYTQPPRPSGRGRDTRPCPVHDFARARGLDVRTPKSLKAEGEQAAFAELGCDAGVVAAYGLILPQAVIEAPRLGCYNVHASLLPRWRGAAPIQRAILAGDGETGVSIMKVDTGLDTGPVLLAEAVPITATTTAGGLHDALAQLGARLMVEALAGVAAGALAPRPQPEQGVTYAAKLAAEDERLDWSKPAGELERAVRALSPSPGVWFEHGGERIKVLEARVVSARNRPGMVLDDAPTVACGDGGLVLRRLQRPGRKPLDGEAFLRGYPLPPGTRLG